MVRDSQNVVGGAIELLAELTEQVGPRRSQANLPIGNCLVGNPYCGTQVDLLEAAQFAHGGDAPSDKFLLGHVVPFPKDMLTRGGDPMYVNSVYSSDLASSTKAGVGACGVQNFFTTYHHARKHIGMPISEAAARLALSEQELRGYEQGKHLPDAVTVAKMAILYNVSSDWLIGLTDTTPDIELKG